MRNTFLVLCLAFLISVISAETIKKSCYPCSGCPKGICLSYDGGPFNSNVGCSTTNYCSFISGSYDIGCSCSLGCGYTASFDGNIISGCSSEPSRSSAHGQSIPILKVISFNRIFYFRNQIKIDGLSLVV